MPTPITGPLTRSPSGGVTGVGGVLGPFAATGAYTAVIGDSIDQGSPAPFSWFDEACRLSGQRMRRYINAGVGGNTTTQMLARINADVVTQSPKPHVCVIGGPTNDYSNGIAPATTQSNIQSMVSALVAAGIKPIIRNCPSRNTAATGAYNTVALVRQAILDHNAWLATYCAANGIPLIDIFTPTYDGSGLTAAYTADGLHLNAAGCYAAASYAAARLPAFINTAARPYLTASASDPLNLVPDGVFGTDAGGDGVADTLGFISISGQAVASSTFDGVGNEQRFTTANGTLGYVFPNPFPAATPTRVYELAFLMKSAVGKSLTVRAQPLDAANAALAAYDAFSGIIPQHTGEQTVFLRFTAPANTAKVRIFIMGDAAGATGEIRIARLTLRDKTVNP